MDIAEVEVLGTEINEIGDIIITVENKVKGAHCNKCDRIVTKFHGHGREITVRHLSILGRKTYIRFSPLRYQCIICDGEPTTTQRLTWHDERSPYTGAYEDHILIQLINSTVEDVSIT